MAVSEKMAGKLLKCSYGRLVLCVWDPSVLPCVHGGAPGDFPRINDLLQRIQDTIKFLNA